MHHQKNNLPAIKNVIVCNYCYKFIGQVSDIVAGIKSVKITSVRMNFLRIGEQKKGKNSKLKYSLAANAAVSNKISNVIQSIDWSYKKISHFLLCLYRTLLISFSHSSFAPSISLSLSCCLSSTASLLPFSLLCELISTLKCA